MNAERKLALAIAFVPDVVLNLMAFMLCAGITNGWTESAVMLIGGMAVALPHACFCFLTLKYGNASFIIWCLVATFTSTVLISGINFGGSILSSSNGIAEPILRFFIAVMGEVAVYAAILLPISKRMRREASVKTFAPVEEKGHGIDVKDDGAAVLRAPSGIALTAKAVKIYRVSVFISLIIAYIYVFQAGALLSAFIGERFGIVLVIVICLLSVYCNRLSVWHMKVHIHFEIGGVLLILGIVLGILLNVVPNSSTSGSSDWLFNNYIICFLGYFVLQGALLLHRRLT